MLVLKIHRERVDTGDTDESDYFIEAKSVIAHNYTERGVAKLEGWADPDYFDYRSLLPTEGTATTPYEVMGGRLIHVVEPDGRDAFYLASAAWLLGPDGRTIERLV